MNNININDIDYSIFNGCSKLTSIIVSKFNTDKVQNMSIMFYGC